MPFIVPSTRTKSPQRKLQEGQAIVLIALLILVLFGMLGLAIDSGRGYVDRRDQQTAVDAAALAAGDWWENYQDLNGVVVPNSVALYESDLRIYSGWSTQTHTSTLVGPQGNLPQDTYTYTFSGSYGLTIVATDTQFNGYEFQFTSTHSLPLAFIQIFGGSKFVSIGATATAIVGNQRQTPALLTLSQNNRGTWTEMYPGQYANFHLSGGSASCAFLNAGVYSWTNGYQSDANGSLVSNELKAPDEENSSAPATTSAADPQFWDQNGVGCAGHFSVVNGAAQTVLAGPTCTKLSPVTPNPCHSGATDTLQRNNRWGVELTSIRYDRFLDPTIAPNPCFAGAGCRRESAPSACKLTPNTVVGSNNAPSDVGITVNITQNAPGAQYYNVYLNPFGCDSNPNHFGWVGRYDAPGFVGGVATGVYPNGTAWALGAAAPAVPPASGASIYDVADTMIANPAAQCFAQTRTLGCATPDDETNPQCFSNCPPPANLLSQENAPMALQYAPYTGGDVANENYCQVSANPGSVIAPCQNTTVTPGAVQFYFPNGSCFDQNSQGATYVFAGEQFNWIVIFAPASNSCSNSMNGGASTQFIGTIYTPGQDWTINGGNRSPLAGQVICYTAKVAGSAAVGIDFNPNYAPAPPAARLIN